MNTTDYLFLVIEELVGGLLEDKTKESHEGVPEDIGWWSTVDWKEGYVLPETSCDVKCC